MGKKNRARVVLRVVLICLFVALIATTAGVTLHAAIESYRYDMDPANGVDIFEGFGAAFALMIGGFIAVCELELFFVLFYLTQKKTVTKTVFNIVCPLCLLMICACFAWDNTLLRAIPDEIIAPLVVVTFFLHGLMRLLYLALCLAGGGEKTPPAAAAGD